MGFAEVIRAHQTVSWVVLWSAEDTTVAVLHCSTALGGPLAETGGEASTQTSHGTWHSADQASEIGLPIGTLNRRPRAGVGAPALGLDPQPCTGGRRPDDELYAVRS
jgi:hypothetical protein